MILITLEYRNILPMTDVLLFCVDINKNFKCFENLFQCMIYLLQFNIYNNNNNNLNICFILNGLNNFVNSNTKSLSYFVSQLIEYLRLKLIYLVNEKCFVNENSKNVQIDILLNDDRNKLNSFDNLIHLNDKIQNENFNLSQYFNHSFNNKNNKNVYQLSNKQYFIDLITTISMICQHKMNEETNVIANLDKTNDKTSKDTNVVIARTLHVEEKMNSKKQGKASHV